MACSINFPKHPLLKIAFLVQFLIFAGFLGIGLFPIILFTSLFLIVSSILLTLTKQNSKPEENEALPIPRSDQEEDSISDSDSSEDSEIECWPFAGDGNSDGSISDEESLIEIALPSGHYIGGTKDEEKPKCSLQQKTESILWQHSLSELLADMNEVNEEDNLIEIDISMGSIKSSRFQIKA